MEPFNLTELVEARRASREQEAGRERLRRQARRKTSAAAPPPSACTGKVQHGRPAERPAS